MGSGVCCGGGAIGCGVCCGGIVIVDVGDPNTVGSTRGGGIDDVARTVG